jgi:thiamine-monophosphate kinase
MRVRELGEFGLIERLVRRLTNGKLPAGAARTVVGVGDDAAVVQSAGRFQIATTDTMVEGVHFQAATASWADIGWKALASNISDIAAMGGTPEFALITLCLPPSLDVEAVDGLYQGLQECATTYDVTIVGGDIVRSPVLTITVALTGHAAVRPRGRPALLLRSAARVGDAIAISGFPGDSAGGLRLLQGSEPFIESEEHGRLVQAHRRPQPRVALGQLLVAEGVRCAIDVSDGLAQDLGHICEMSHVGAVVGVDRIPLSAALVRAFPDDALELAVGGGEDYELLFTAPLPVVNRVIERARIPVTVIGEVVRPSERPVRFIDEGGDEVRFEHLGWDHLAGGTAAA